MRRNKKVSAIFLATILLLNVMLATAFAQGEGSRAVDNHREVLTAASMVENQLVLKVLVIVASVVGIALFCSMVNWKRKIR